ncbi:MAG TPA: twin-arginine translocation signal domain-containing protein [Bradyrhizobium sp.]
MERRHFLKFAVGFAAGAAALAASAQAAPLAPQPLAKDERPPSNENIRPAITTEDEVDRLKPEQVRWGHHWHHRHWGWRHRHWRRWHRRHWRHRRYW